eukprot:gene9164-10117_t
MKYKIGPEIIFIFLLFTSYALSFSLTTHKSCFAVQRTYSTPSSGVSYVTLFAKKAKGSPKTRKGFGKPVATTTTTSSGEEDEVKEVNSSLSSPSETISTEAQPTRTTPVIPPTTESTVQHKDDDDVLQAVYSRYKGSAVKPNQQLKKKAKKIVDEEGFGGKVLAKIPLPLQEKIDNILLWGTSLSLTTVIVIGLAASSGALKVVYPDVHIPEAADRFIQDALIPALTPTIIFFLFFSVTFGLFKFAQISSSETTYREE